MMHWIHVLEMTTGEHIGYGYLICDSEGNMQSPMIFDKEGGLLPLEWYNLQMTHTEWLVVFPTRSQ